MSALQNEINKLNTLKESFNELSKKVLDTQAVLTELNHGKQDIVDAVNTRGVTSSTDKTLSQIANDIKSIAQNPVTIDGGDLYETQLFGGTGDDAPFWNLYKVMADLLSDGRFNTYGGILLAEYSKGGDTFALEGAGAGGAYLTSDGKMYVEDVTHTWDDTYDGKGNRWIAYFFASEWRNFNITSFESSPTSIHIGRCVGTISCLSKGKVAEVVVTDGNKLKSFNSNGFEQGWNKSITFKNIDEPYIYKPINTKYINFECDELKSTLICPYNCDVESIVIKQNNVDYMVNNIIIGGSNNNYLDSLRTLIIKGVKTIKGYYRSNMGVISGLDNTTRVDIIFEDTNTIIEESAINNTPVLFTSCETARNCKIYFPSLETAKYAYIGKINPVYMYVGYSQNSKENPIVFKLGYAANIYTNLIDFEIKNGFCKSLDIGTITNNLTEENMINHILKRLKQDEELCGEGVTITLGATNLARLTSDESVALLDSLTNTYGYTFA